MHTPELALERPSASSSPSAGSEPKTVYAGAVNYLKLAGVLCGWQMARAP
jgi:hypothetical protein